jgi:hypothetical protein
LIYVYSTQDFAGADFRYSYILATVGVLMALKVFVITFAQLERYLLEKKYILVVIEIILAGTQLALAFLAVGFLSETKSPTQTIQFFLISNIFFYIQSFIGKLPDVFKLAAFSFVGFGLSYVVLQRQLFFNDGPSYLLLLQTISYIGVFIEFFLLMMVTRNFLDKRVD